MNKDLQAAVGSVRNHLVPLLGDPTEADALRLLLRRGISQDLGRPLKSIGQGPEGGVLRKVGVRVSRDMAKEIELVASRFSNFSGEPNMSRAIRWLLWAGFDAYQDEIGESLVKGRSGARTGLIN